MGYTRLQSPPEDSSGGTPAAVGTDRSPKSRADSTDIVISFVREGISRGEFRLGDRLLPERELAAQLGLSRPTVRAGLRALTAMGVIESRRGSGTYIQGGPPRLGSESLSLLADLHGFTRDEVYEVRRLLEVGAVGLAAERASDGQLTNIAQEVANMFASMQEPRTFLLHDIEFHRMVAAASGNALLATVVEMVAALYYERRRQTVEHATRRSLEETAEMHRSIYEAIHARDAGQARHLMNDHLAHSAASQSGGDPARRDGHSGD